MPAVERKIPGSFFKVPGGYTQQTGPNTQIFVPDMCASSYNPDTGDLHGYAPDYDAMEAAKAPSVAADKPGVYAYYYETQHAPTGCDFSSQLAYYGKHYYLRPLRDGLSRLCGRGITYDERDGTYTVTIRAYEKLKTQYRISHEMCFD